MKRLLVLLACLLAVPAQGQILSIIMGGTNQPASTPTFSPAAGAVANPTTVTASTATSDGCTIYFDTSNPPVTAQTTYSVTTGVTLYAQAKGCAHHRDSAVGSATYTISAGASYSDNFPYSAGDLQTNSGGNWTYSTGCTGVFDVYPTTGTIVVYPNSSSCFARWSGAGTFTPSQYATVSFTTGADFAGPAVLIAPSAMTGYGLDCSIVNTDCVLFKWVSGTYTLLATSGAGTFANGDVMELEVVVTSNAALTVKRNGSVVSALSYTDSSSPILTGVPGMLGNYQSAFGLISNASGGSGSL